MKRLVLIVALLAVVAGACGSQVNVESAPADVALSDAGDVDPALDAGDPPATAEPEPSPTPETEPTEVATATPGPADVDDIDEAGQIASTAFSDLDELPDTFLPCVLGQMADDGDLTRILIELGSQDFSALEASDRSRAVDVALDCLGPEFFATEFAAAFAEGAEEEGYNLPADAGECFGETLSDPADQRAAVELGLAEPEDMTVEMALPLATAMVACLPPEFFSEAMVAEISSDPDFIGDAEDVFDSECLDRVFSDAMFVAELMVVGAGDVEFGEGDLSAFEPMFNCFDFGAVIQGTAAAEGYTISDASAECLNEKMRDAGLMARLLSGDEPADAEIGALVLACFTPEEIANLAG